MEVLLDFMLFSFFILEVLYVKFLEIILEIFLKD